MTERKIIKAGLLGLGTVGTGVYKLAKRQKEEIEKKTGVSLQIEGILVHNIEKKREGVDPSLLTDNYRDLTGNEEISVIIEVMGGIEPAKTIILEAMRAAKA